MDRVDAELLLGRRRGGQRLARDRRGEPAHELEQAGPARVDHARVAENVERLLRARDRLLPAPDDRRKQVGVRLSGAGVLLRLLGELADDREHRPLDRVPDCAIRGVARGAEAACDRLWVDRVALRERLAGAADDLRQDHAGVAAGAHRARHA